MAKLEIIQSQAKVADSKAPRFSTLSLPMSLASTVGSGYSAVGKAIADIQKDIYALEDQNQVNEILPDVNLKITLIKNSIFENLLKHKVVFNKYICIKLK